MMIATAKAAVHPLANAVKIAKNGLSLSASNTANKPVAAEKQRQVNQYFICHSPLQRSVLSSKVPTAHLVP